MYTPSAFAVDDADELFALAAAYPFASLVTSHDDGVLVSHLPLLVDPLRRSLRGHLARENPQLGHLAGGASVLTVFHGPHGYVSPSVYAGGEPSVPTWNYVVVHAHGRARIVDEGELRGILGDMVVHFDDTGWRVTEDDEYLRRMLGAIAGFEIQVDCLEGKWKVSQNRSLEDQRSVASWLARGDASSRALADLMRRRS